uniref:Uncharacterized protein n=1 Tax=Plectus sambesii TaxID=2011161 RepID=A0A914VPC4_9BILA
MRTVLVNADDLSLEAMTPIQTILRKTEDLKGAKRKLSWACAAMR